MLQSLYKWISLNFLIVTRRNCISSLPILPTTQAHCQTLKNEMDDENISKNFFIKL